MMSGDVKALRELAASLDPSDDPAYALLIRVADALEAVSARPLVADREAVERAFDSHERIEFDGRTVIVIGDEQEVTDALFASGVIQSKGDAQAEALEELYAEIAALPADEDADVLMWVADLAMARAAAYRTPASLTEGNDS